MTASASRTTRELAKRGVVLPHPASVDIALSVRLDRIAPGVTIHAGCRIGGKETSIGPGSVIGEEAPVTMDNCQLGGNSNQRHSDAVLGIGVPVNIGWYPTFTGD